MWLFLKKNIPLHTQFATCQPHVFVNAPLAQLVEQLTLNQWV